MTGRPLLIGVDAGGTKTRVVLAEGAPASSSLEEGRPTPVALPEARPTPRPLAEVVGAAGDLPAVGDDGMVERLAGLVAEAVRAAGRSDGGRRVSGGATGASGDSPGFAAGDAAGGSTGESRGDPDASASHAAAVRSIASAALGIPGWGVSEPWNARWTAVARRALPSSRIVLLNDVVLAREGAFASAAGVLALAGTGAMACARGQDGRLVTVGGWGFAFGDEGGGYDLAREALRAASRAVDGRGPATSLAERIPAALEVGSLMDVVEALMADFARLRTRTAALAPVVLTAADDGDEVADRLVRTAAHALAEQVDAARRALGDAELPLAGAGGLFASAVFRAAFAHAAAAFALPECAAPEETATEAALRLAGEVAELEAPPAEGRHRGFTVVEPVAPTR